MTTDDIDRFGHCVICHKNLLIKRIVDGKEVDMFMPIYSETKFLLNTGSEMSVTICKPCKETNDLNDPIVKDNIMQAVYKGWELENKILVADENNPSWTEEFGAKYLANQATLSIDMNSEDLDKYVIQQRQMELLNKKVELLPGQVIDGIN